LGEGPEATQLIELESFFVYALPDLGAHVLDTTFRSGLRAACERLGADALAARASILVLDDAGPDLPVPSALAVGAVNAALVRAGVRSRTSIVVVSDEPRNPHSFAVLLGYGADAICPRLALETVAAAAAADAVGADRPSPAEAQRRLRTAIEDGVLKVM